MLFTRSLLYSVPRTDEIALSRAWLKELKPSTLPLRYFVVRYDRSSGPGGQNVNKVNSKCTMSLHNFSNCSLFPKLVREQLLEKNFRYYNSVSDSLVVQSDQTRSREQNRQICMEKLVSEINKVCYFPEETSEETLRKWESIKKASNERRLKSKKYTSEKKRSRKLFY